MALIAIAAILVLAGNGAEPESGAGSSPTSAAAPTDVLYLETFGSRSQLSAVDTRTGRVRAVPISFDCGDTTYCLISTAGKLVIGGLGITKVYDPARPGPAHTDRIGRGYVAIPSADPGSVWIGILATQPNGHKAGKLSSVEEIDLQGKVLRREVPPDGQWPILATKSGLVFERRADIQFRHFGSTSSSTRLPGAPAASHGNLIASCTSPCLRYSVTNVATGEVSKLSPPSGYRFRGYNGEFSHDGSWLAAQAFPDGKHRGGRHLRWSQLAIVNLRTGESKIASPHLNDAYNPFSWSAFRDRLYFVASDSKIHSYTPGSKSSETIAALPRRISVVQMTALRSPEL